MRNEARKPKSRMISFRVDEDYLSSARCSGAADQLFARRGASSMPRRGSAQEHHRCTGAHRGCTGARRPQPHRRPPQARHPRGRQRPVQLQQTEPRASRLHHPSPSGGGASSGAAVIVRHQRASASNKGFRQLARYIRGRSDKPRATWFLAANLPGVTGPRRPRARLHARRRRATRRTPAPGSKRTYHLVISLHPDDRRLDGKELRQVVENLVETLGFSEHQYIAVRHNDTDHEHIHVAINKIHPETFRIHSPAWDHQKLFTGARALERELGLTPLRSRTREREKVPQTGGGLRSPPWNRQLRALGPGKASACSSRDRVAKLGRRARRLQPFWRSDWRARQRAGVRGRRARRTGESFVRG